MKWKQIKYPDATSPRHNSFDAICMVCYDLLSHNSQGKNEGIYIQGEQFAQ